MRYQQVCIESLGYTLPEEILSSDEVERRLAPLYQRLRLPEGRLELMSGIKERRLWPRGTQPSEMSIQSGRRALEKTDIDRGEIGALIHGSVCRDYLEPATACGVHFELGLRQDCVVYDVSNACLGMLNGMIQVANMIELGQIRAGLVVGTEDSRQLVESTIAQLNRDETLTRESIKLAVASLTIGSASAAVLLTHRDLSTTGHRLTTVSVRAHTNHYQLCQGGHEPSIGGSQILMQTDSEKLLAEGIATGQATFANFLNESGWSRNEIDRTICHQVGSAHRKQMLQSLELNPERDFCTYPWLGNTGSVALPITLAIAQEQQFLQPRERVALLGIGSGINCVMAGVEWGK
ncbi:MAG: 3-oxoacyl-ACP synthase III [Planctomycetales bacterium]|nr:3-oxoacyl-ACP synthase III [Planctomycetales bacterium]